MMKPISAALASAIAISSRRPAFIARSRRPPFPQHAANHREDLGAVLVDAPCAAGREPPLRPLGFGQIFDTAEISDAIAGPDRDRPTQIAHARRDADFWQRLAAFRRLGAPALAIFHDQAHADAGSMPARSDQRAVDRSPPGFVAQVKGLRIIEDGEGDDRFARENLSAQFVLDADRHIFEEEAHAAPSAEGRRLRSAISFSVITISSFWLMTSKKNSTMPSSGRDFDGRAAATVHLALSRSPGLTGLVHLISSTPSPPWLAIRLRNAS